MIKECGYSHAIYINNIMKERTDSKQIWEQYESPGRDPRGGIPFPDGRGEVDSSNGWTDTGFEELHEDLKDAFKAALEIDAKLPDAKKGEDYAEIHHNLLAQIKNFIEEIEIKIHN